MVDTSIESPLEASPGCESRFLEFKRKKVASFPCFTAGSVACRQNQHNSLNCCLRLPAHAYRSAKPRSKPCCAVSGSYVNFELGKRQGKPSSHSSFRKEPT